MFRSIEAVVVCTVSNITPFNTKARFLYGIQHKKRVSVVKGLNYEI